MAITPTAPTSSPTTTTTPTTATPNGEAPLVRRRAQVKRAMPKPTPVYFVFQVLDNAGAPTSFSKANIKVIACERNTDKVLDIIDGDDFEHAVYVRAMLQPARVPGSRAE
jgi:hypothetical protein